MEFCAGIKELFIYLFLINKGASQIVFNVLLH